MQTLRERIRDWTDWDVAEYELGVVFGLWPEFGSDPEGDPWNGRKGTVWSANPVGDMLSETLQALAKAKVLEYDEEDHRYRCTPT
jgi:hypothetical protein